MTPSFLRTRSHRRPQLENAFTVLELMVVLAIMALLATLAIKNLDKIFVDAREATAELFLKTTLKVPLKSYQIHMGDYPSTAEGLQALINAPSSKADRWKGPYLEETKVPEDPWGEPYQYRYPGVKNKYSYDAWSKGQDKQDGTADDIGNWSKEAAPAAK